MPVIVGGASLVFKDINVLAVGVIVFLGIVCVHVPIANLMPNFLSFLSSNYCRRLGVRAFLRWIEEIFFAQFVAAVKV